MTTGTQANNARARFILSVIITYATMFIFGLVDNLKAVTLPLIKEEFGISYGAQGSLVSFGAFGYVIFCLIAGVSLSRFGIKKSLLLGYFLLCVGVSVIFFSPTVLFFTAALFIINAGFGFAELSSNALATVTFTKRSALLLNLMHFSFGVGAIVGPKAAGLLVVSGFSWRVPYVFMILPAAALFLAIALAKLEKTDNQAPQKATGPYTFLSATRDKDVWYFGLLLGFMVVGEVGTVNWGGLYLYDVYAMDPASEGATFVSVFFIFYTVSRLISGFAIEKIGYSKSLLIAAVSTALLFACGFGLGARGIWILPVTGFFIGIMWPTLIAVAMKYFQGDAPLATGAMIAIAGAVNSVAQYVIGLTNQFAGNAWGYRSCALYAVVIVLMVLPLKKKTRGAR